MIYDDCLASSPREILRLQDATHIDDSLDSSPLVIVFDFSSGAPNAPNTYQVRAIALHAAPYVITRSLRFCRSLLSPSAALPSPPPLILRQPWDGGTFESRPYL